MTPEELKKKIEEAAEIFARDMYGDEVPNTAYLELLMHTFKSGAEFGMKLEREAAQELVEALEWCIKTFGSKADGMGEVSVIEKSEQALARWRERRG